MRLILTRSTLVSYFLQYIDLEYSGGGIGEYQYWDRKNKRWDNSACKEHGSGRCVKMDCHEPDTHFDLLGYFKEPSYATWMEQLFKHEGMCVWTDEEYNFMQEGKKLGSLTWGSRLSDASFSHCMLQRSRGLA